MEISIDLRLYFLFGVPTGCYTFILCRISFRAWFIRQVLWLRVGQHQLDSAVKALGKVAYFFFD
jgi:hypothetical protein